MRLPWLVLGALVLAGGCSATQSNLPPGAACVRSTQCMGGLACVGGMCSSDVSGLLDGATVPPVDMGNTEAAPPVDTGVTPADMGPPVDLGTMMVDLGPPPPDLGPPDLGPPDLGPPDLGPPDLGGD